MAYRKKMRKTASKRLFRKGANRTRKINVSPRPMRGGIRL